MVGRAAPRVFMSYARGAAEHDAAVTELWRVLRAQGVDALVDAGLGDHRRAWTGAEIAAADFVLVLASPDYRLQAAADGPVDGPADGGHGVFWEARTLGEAVRAGQDTDSPRRILPVLLPGQGVAGLPDFLARHAGPHYRVDPFTGAGVEALVGALLGEGPPPPGAPRRPAAPARLELDVTVQDGLIRAVAVLAGTPPRVREAPRPRSFVDDGAGLAESLLGPQLLGQVAEAVRRLPIGATFEIVVSADGDTLALPYEWMPVVAMAGVSLVRRVRGPARAERPGLAGPLKILAAVAAPERTRSVPLDVEAEMRAVIDVVGGLGQAEVRILEVAGRDEIDVALRRDRYHVLHLVARCTGDGVELEDEDGNAVPVPTTELAGLLGRPGHPVPLVVVVGAAGPELAIDLVRHGADRVLALPPSDLGLAGRLYAELARDNRPVAAALAAAGDPGWPPPPLVTAVDDPPLVDCAADPVGLGPPDVAPSGVEVRELRPGELVGRRPQLRRALRALRGGPLADAEFGAVAGVVFTGVDGIGKTALAGRVIARLRVDDPPWPVAVHVGRWSPDRLLRAVGQALPAQREALSGSGGMGVLRALLGQHRLLLVFDDFDPNLSADGESFVDIAVAGAFRRLCDAATLGRLLVTSRHPVPAAAGLVRVEVPPLTPAEGARLALRTPHPPLTGENCTKTWNPHR